MTDIVETVRKTLADAFGVKVTTSRAGTVVEALSAAGVELVAVTRTTVVNVHHVDPTPWKELLDKAAETNGLLVTLTGSAGRAPGAYDDQAYRE